MQALAAGQQEYLVSIQHNHPDTHGVFYSRGKIVAESLDSARGKADPWIKRKMAQRHCICFSKIACEVAVMEFPEELKSVEDKLEDFEIIW